MTAEMSMQVNRAYFITLCSKDAYNSVLAADTHTADNSSTNDSHDVDTLTTTIRVTSTKAYL